MKFLIPGLRTFFVALVTILFLILIALSLGWHTPLVNYFASPYKVSVSHTELNWFPLALEIEGLEMGEGDAALNLDQISVRSGFGFLTGKPIELYVQLKKGQVSYQQLSSGNDVNPQWQVAGLELQAWQQIFSSEQSNNTDKLQEDSSAVQRPPMVIHLQSLQIDNFMVRSLQKGLPDLQLNRLLFGPFHTEKPDMSSSLQVGLATAGGQLDLNGTLSPLSSSPRANFDLSLADFSPRHDWLSQIPPELSATLNTKLALSLTLPQTEKQDKHGRQSLKAELTGDLELNQTKWQPLVNKAPIDHRVPDTETSLEADDQKIDSKKEVVESHSADRLPATGDMSGADDQENYSVEKLALKNLALSVQISDLSAPEPQVTFESDQLELQGINIHQAQQSYQFQSVLMNQLSVDSDLSQVLPSVRLSLHEVQLSAFDLREPDLRYQLQSLLLTQLDASVSQSEADIRSGTLQLSQGIVDYRLANNMSAPEKPEHPTTPSQASQLPEQEVTNGDTEDAADKTDGNKAGDSEPEKSTDVTTPNVIKKDSTPYRVSYAGELVSLKEHQITYRDLNLEDAPLTQIELADFTLKQPRYPAPEPFPWLANVWLNGQSHWQVKGELQTTPLKIKMAIEQSGLSLPDISPYSEHYADVVFAQGMMDNKIELTITPQSLKGSLGFDFTNLDMTLKGSQANLNLPLQTAFSLLEDSDSRIELSIDLDKKGKDFKVGTKAIVKELLLAASQKGAVAYLKYALQPYGALLTLKEVGSGLLRSGSLPLEPVLLNPLQEDFTVDQQGYAQKVGGILENKSAFNLHYCYLSSDAEREQLLKQLGDADKADSAYRALNQTRLTRWRKLFAEQGLASRINQCTQAEQKKHRKQLKSAEIQQSRFTLLLKP